MSKLTKALTAAAGNAGGDSLYVEDVFSTYLYVGTGSTIAINNGIDLDGKGGMVWFKTRSTANGHNIYDTERGNGKLQYITSEPTYTNTNTPWNPTSTGFNTGGDYGGSETQNGSTTVSWTFRKAEKFFDVVTYTGDGVAGRTVAHNLGSTPAVMIFKRTDASGIWPVYVSALGATDLLRLNITNESFTSSDYFNNTAPTDSVFTVGNSSNINASGGSYVAYLFASDAGGFGDDGSEDIIKCGSFTTNASGNAVVNLGFEPSWLMIKKSSGSSNWEIRDDMRGFGPGASADLKANVSDAESSPEVNKVFATAQGFEANVGSSSDYIYIAIRRPMKTPEAGTEVFAPVAYSGNSTAGRSITSGFPLDVVLTKGRNAAIEPILYSRLQGSAKKLLPYSTAAEANSSTNVITSFDQDGMTVGTDTDINNSSYTYIDYFFKRATGFFDVVTYKGDGSGAKSFNHNLGVAPELLINKIRSSSDSWYVFVSSLGANQRLKLNEDIASGSSSLWNSTAPTATQFTVASGLNPSSETFVNYLFATLAGVSKVGSYTGTGSNVDVDCGFSAGARFILIKRTDSTGDWYVWDTERGITAGNDPYLLLNSSAAEVTSTDYIDPLASGFTVTSSAPAALNASGGSYIFLAIA